MILTAHQPLYLPWLRLFHKIAIADKFIFFDQVQYIKKSWFNRNQIKTANGTVILTVPILNKGYREKKIAELEINNDIPWQRKHWKTFQLGYQKAPFFTKYADFFEDVYQREWQYFSDLTFYMLQWFLRELGIDTVVEKAEDYDFQGAKSDLVLDMCLKVGASKYIFGEGGSGYALVDDFRAVGIESLFQNYTCPVYSQLHGTFIPDLSVIDLLFNEGPNSLDILLQGSRI